MKYDDNTTHLLARLEYTFLHWDNWPLSTQVHQLTSCFCDWHFWKAVQWWRGKQPKGNHQ